MFVLGFERHPNEQPFPETVIRFENEAEMLQQAEATLAAAVDIISLSLPQTPAQEELRNRYLTLTAEARRITAALEQEQWHLSNLQEEARDETKTNDNIKQNADAQQQMVQEKEKDKDPAFTNIEKNSHAAVTATICIGAFKLLRPKGPGLLNKKFITMETLQQEVCEKLCDYFKNMKKRLRPAQIVIEARGQKLSVRN